MKNFTLNNGTTIELPEFKEVKEYVYTHDVNGEDADLEFDAHFNLYADGVYDDDYLEECSSISDLYNALVMNKLIEYFTSKHADNDDFCEMMMEDYTDFEEEDK